MPANLGYRQAGWEFGSLSGHPWRALPPLHNPSKFPQTRASAVYIRQWVGVGAPPSIYIYEAWRFWFPPLQLHLLTDRVGPGFAGWLIKALCRVEVKLTDLLVLVLNHWGMRSLYSCQAWLRFSFWTFKQACWRIWEVNVWSIVAWISSVAPGVRGAVLDRGGQRREFLFHLGGNCVKSLSLLLLYRNPRIGEQRLLHLQRTSS